MPKLVILWAQESTYPFQIGKKMKHDDSDKSDGANTDKFESQLLEQTIENLKDSYGDLEAVKSSLFLFVNRAYESKLAEENISEILGVAVVRARYSEAEEDWAFEIADKFAEIAKATHRNNA